MSTEALADNPRWARRLNAGLGLYALIGGGASFSGWALNVPRLTDWINTGVSIQPNAAVLIALAGAGLLLQQSSRHLTSGIGGVVVIFGGLTLLQYMVGADFGFNHQLLFGRTWGQGTTLTPGRVGPPASSSFLLIGAALLFLTFPRLRVARRAVAVAGVAVCALMLFSLMGYLFGARDFYAIPSLSAIALQTATMLLALAIGLIVSVPEHQPMLLLREHSTAGVMARTVLPILLVMIPSVIWLRVKGYELDLYDTGTSRALGAITLMFGATTLMWTALLALRRREQSERENEAWLAGQKEALQAAVNDEELHVSLGVLIRTAIQQLGEDTRAAFYLVKPDGENPHYIVGESEIYSTFVDGLKLSPDPLAWGLVAHTGRPAITRDARTDPLWKQWHWLAEKHRFHACWSFPVQTSAGRVVGTFVLYLGKPRDPTLRDRALVDMITQAAAIIIARKEAATALRHSEELYRSLASIIADVSWVTDAHGAFVAPQPAWERFTGQRSDEYMGFGWVNALHPDDRERVKEIWLKACAEKTLYESRGRLWHAASQSYHYYVARGIPVLNQDGSGHSWVGACSDIHEQTMAEQALRESDHRKDGFLATLAHELRNPLAPITTGLEIMKALTADSDKLEDIRRMMQRQVNQLVTLVNDLLDVSRITLGKIELRRRRVTLTEIVQSALEASRPFINEGKHDLECDIPTDPVELDGDPNRLAQVLSNLLNNAAKYTPQGGRIRLAAEKQGGDVVISVKDTGIGIRTEMLKRIFEMFAQGTHPLEKGASGLGIGLALSRSLIELHNGSIEVRSDGPGKGSEFRVRLPLQAETPLEDQVQHTRTSLAKHKRRVLVVDDNQAAAGMLGVLVEMLGHEVRTAHSGLEGIQVAAEFKPELIFMDIGMPEITGLEAARQIRQQPWGKAIRVVAVTGWGQDQDKLLTREVGFDQHLVKPATIGDLHQEFYELDLRDSNH